MVKIVNNVNKEGNMVDILNKIKMINRVNISNKVNMINTLKFSAVQHYQSTGSKSSTRPTWFFLVNMVKPVNNVMDNMI